MQNLVLDKPALDEHKTSCWNYPSYENIFQLAALFSSS